MISISVTSNADEVLRRLDQHREQMGFALSVALNRTAVRVRDAEQRELRDSFDRPTPYTLNSLRAKMSTKRDLNAYVWLREDGGKGTPADRYLAPQIEGGPRQMKRFERALQAVGALPPGWIAVPGAGADMDAHGNMSRGQIVQILSYFRAFQTAGYRANITDKRKRRLARGTKKQQGFAYFVGRPGGGRGPLGVWKRTRFVFGTAIKPILIFVNGSNYQRRLEWHYTAQRTVDLHFNAELERSVGEALRTAR